VDAEAATSLALKGLIETFCSKGKVAIADWSKRLPSYGYIMSPLGLHLSISGYFLSGAASVL